MADDDFADENPVKGIPGKVGDFVYSSKRVLNVAKKPDWNEYKSIGKITAIGIGVIGIIGYVIILIFALLRG